MPKNTSTKVAKAKKAGPPQVEWEKIEGDINDPELRVRVHKLVSRHRKTGHPPESQILDALRNRERHDKAMAELRSLLADKGASAASACQRWRNLIQWGLRMFAREARLGREVVRFADAARAETLHGKKDSPQSPALLWAQATRAATNTLLPVARSAGFDAAGTKPIHALSRALDAAMRGKEVDLESPVADVDMIVAEITSQNANPERVSFSDAVNGRPEHQLPPTAKETLVRWIQNPRTAASLGVDPKGVVDAQMPFIEGLLRLQADPRNNPDLWYPTAHQQEVLAVLKRDGRMRTGALWMRIARKHVNPRAHQYAVSDLVARGEVSKSGKGRATEYWLP